LELRGRDVCGEDCFVQFRGESAQSYRLAALARLSVWFGCNGLYGTLTVGWTAEAVTARSRAVGVCRLRDVVGIGVLGDTREAGLGVLGISREEPLGAI